MFYSFSWTETHPDNAVRSWFILSCVRLNLASVFCTCTRNKKPRWYLRRRLLILFLPATDLWNQRPPGKSPGEGTVVNVQNVETRLNRLPPALSGCVSPTLRNSFWYRLTCLCGLWKSSFSRTNNVSADDLQHASALQVQVYLQKEIEDSFGGPPCRTHINIKESRSDNKKRLWDPPRPRRNVSGRVACACACKWSLINYICKLRTGGRSNQNNFSPDSRSNGLLADLFVTWLDVTLEGRRCEHCVLSPHTWQHISK